MWSLSRMRWITRVRMASLIIMLSSTSTKLAFLPDFARRSGAIFAGVANAFSK